MNAVQEILVGDSNVVLTGGSDSMSACPYAVRDIRSDTDGIFNGFSFENNVKFVTISERCCTVYCTKKRLA